MALYAKNLRNYGCILYMMSCWIYITSASAVAVVLGVKRAWVSCVQTWTPKVCKTMVFRLFFGGFGLLLYILLGSRHVFKGFQNHRGPYKSRVGSPCFGSEFLEGSDAEFRAYTGSMATSFLSCSGRTRSIIHAGTRS